MRIVWGHETDSNPGRYSLRQFHMVDNEDEEKSPGEISNLKVEQRNLRNPEQLMLHDDGWKYLMEACTRSR